MVILNVEVEGEKKTLMMDGELHRQLTKYVIPDVQKKDFDYVLVVDGEERVGKSVFAMQIAKVLDPNLNVKNICFTPQEFIKAVTTAKPHSAIIFDEAFTGMSSRASLSEVNNLLVSLMMEMGQRNLFIIIVMPTYFMLEKYVVFHRTRGLFHVYMEQGRRGLWKFYNRYAIKRMYEKGRRFMEYIGARHSMFGRFSDNYMVDEKAYRAKKSAILTKKRFSTRAERYIGQRDALVYAMYKELGKTQAEIARMASKYGFKVAQRTISDILAEKAREIAAKEGFSQ